MRLAALPAIACALACSHNTLPGTQIDDTPQNRAVLDVFSKYREALQARDPSGILALVAPSYYDPGDASHSLPPTDYTSLQAKLQKDFARITGLRLDATVKDIQVKGDEAHLDYFQVLRYAVAIPGGEKWKSESDDARMKFVKADGQWKISSGL